jgi:hypothetical protein
MLRKPIKGGDPSVLFWLLLCIGGFLLYAYLLDRIIMDYAAKLLFLR